MPGSSLHSLDPVQDGSWHRSRSGIAWKMVYLTCPAWKSAGHRSSSQEYNQPQGDRCDRAFSGHSGTPGKLPGHHGKGSRKHQRPPLGWHQSDSHPSIRPLKTQATTIELLVLDGFLVSSALCDSYPNTTLCLKHFVVLINTMLTPQTLKVCPEVQYNSVYSSPYPWKR